MNCYDVIRSCLWVTCIRGRGLSVDDKLVLDDQFSIVQLQKQPISLIDQQEVSITKLNHNIRHQKAYHNKSKLVNQSQILPRGSLKLVRNSGFLFSMTLCMTTPDSFPLSLCVTENTYVTPETWTNLASNRTPSKSIERLGSGDLLSGDELARQGMCLNSIDPRYPAIIRHLKPFRWIIRNRMYYSSVTSINEGAYASPSSEGNCKTSFISRSFKS